MKRPMLLFTAFYILGVLLGQYEASGIVFFFFAAAATVLYFYLYRTRFILLAVFFAVLGYVNALNAQDPYLYDQQYAEISGRVVEAGKSANREWYVIKTKEYSRIRIYPRSSSTELGREVTVAGILVAPDEERLVYYRKNKIMYIMFAEIVHEGDIRNSPLIVLRSFQQKLSGIYDALLPDKQAAVVKSMIIGDKSELSDEIKEIYQTAGIIHILSISGLHVTALAMALKKILSMLSLGQRTVNMATTAFLIFYCILTGMGVATVRATIMCITMLAGELLYRDNDTLSAVALAALAVLIYEPYYLFDAGFQYSFVTVFCLVTCTAPLERAFVHLAGKAAFLEPLLTQKYVSKYLAGCVTATLASYPVTAYHFLRIPIYSIISNLFISGSVFAVVILGFLAGSAGLISITAGTFVSGGLYALLWLYERLCVFISNLPYADLRVDKPSIFYIACYYMVIFLFAYIFKYKSGDKI